MPLSLSSKVLALALLLVRAKATPAKYYNVGGQFAGSSVHTSASVPASESGILYKNIAGSSVDAAMSGGGVTFVFSARLDALSNGYVAIVDCGNGEDDNNVVIGVTGNTIYALSSAGNMTTLTSASTYTFQVGVPARFAVMFGSNRGIQVYAGSVKIASSSGTNVAPLAVSRSLCFLGRSNRWSRNDPLLQGAVWDFYILPGELSMPTLAYNAAVTTVTTSSSSSTTESQTTTSESATSTSLSTETGTTTLTATTETSSTSDTSTTQTETMLTTTQTTTATETTPVTTMSSTPGVTTASTVTETTSATDTSSSTTKTIMTAAAAAPTPETTSTTKTITVTATAPTTVIAAATTTVATLQSIGATTQTTTDTATTASASETVTLPAGGTSTPTVTPTTSLTFTASSTTETAMAAGAAVAASSTATSTTSRIGSTETSTQTAAWNASAEPMTAISTDMPGLGLGAVSSGGGAAAPQNSSAAQVANGSSSTNRNASNASNATPSPGASAGATGSTGLVVGSVVGSLAALATGAVAFQAIRLHLRRRSLGVISQAPGLENLEDVLPCEPGEGDGDGESGNEPKTPPSPRDFVDPHTPQNLHPTLLTAPDPWDKVLEI